MTMATKRQKVSMAQSNASAASVVTKILRERDMTMPEIVALTLFLGIVTNKFGLK